MGGVLKSTMGENGEFGKKHCGKWESSRDNITWETDWGKWLLMVLSRDHSTSRQCIKSLNIPPERSGIVLFDIIAKPPVPHIVAGGMKIF